MTDIRKIRCGDSVEGRPLLGYRFWMYGPGSNLREHKISSFQWETNWPVGGYAKGREPSEYSEGGGHGINVYKTIADAMNGSGGAVNAVTAGTFNENHRYGLVLGKVKFWGIVWEHQHGYRAQYVQPILFEQAWGYRPRQTLTDLNALWFGREKAYG
jgi:hypothetical protein